MNKPTKITSVTVGNRVKCCGERLENLEIKAGMKNDMTNEIIGTFKGPGRTGVKYLIPLTKTVVARYLTFQLNKTKGVLQIEGIKLNQRQSHGKCI